MHATKRYSNLVLLGLAHDRDGQLFLGLARRWWMVAKEFAFFAASSFALFDVVFCDTTAFQVILDFSRCHAPEVFLTDR